MSTLKALIKLAIKDALNYDQYMQLMLDLVEEEKSTGLEQSEALTNYTLLNSKRMARLNKTLKISKEVQISINKDHRKLLFIVLTESWCGDAAQSIPIWAKVVAHNPNWELLLVSRDAHLALMELFLTAGSKSIPKVLVLNAQNYELLHHWGPRPSALSQLVLDFKAANGTLTAEFKTAIQQWYNKDKGQTTLEDLLKLLQIV